MLPINNLGTDQFNLFSQALFLEDLKKNKDDVSFTLKQYFIQDVNTIFISETPILHYFCQEGELDIVRQLLKAGANCNLPDSKRGRTPLFYAVDHDILQLLIKHGANTQHLDKDGSTPLNTLKSCKSQDTTAITFMEHQDRGFSKMCNIVAMVYSRFSTPESPFDGMFPWVANNAIATSLQAFRYSPSRIWQKRVMHIASLFSDRVSLQLPKDNSNTLQITCPGWFGHSVSLVKNNRWLARGNRGEGCTQANSGITFFKIVNKKRMSNWLLSLETAFGKRASYKEIKQLQDTHLLTYTTAKQRIQNDFTQQAINLFNQENPAVTGLKKIYHLAQPFQTSPNCTWVAAKMSFKSACVLESLAAGHDMPSALSCAKRVYSAWLTHDYKHAFEQLASVASQTQNSPFNIDDIFLRAIVANKKRRPELIAQAITLRPELKHCQDSRHKGSLLHYLSEDAASTIAAIRAGVDPYLIDSHGNTLLNYIMYYDNITLFSELIEKRGYQFIQDQTDSNLLLQAIRFHAVKITSHLLFTKKVDCIANQAYIQASKSTPQMAPLFAAYRDSRNRSLLFIANDPDIAQFLIDGQVSMDAVDNQGENALHNLSRASAFESLELVLKALPTSLFSAAISKKNKWGLTPMDYLLRLAPSSPRDRIAALMSLSF